MGISGYSHAWRAVVLAWGIAWFGPAADLSAGTLDATASLEPDGRSAEPFGLSASVLSFGGLREKWLDVERKLDDERVQLALCDGDRERCVSPAALQLLAIVDVARAREGRARLGEINRAINLAIRPMSDLAQYGVLDFWSSPLVTFASGAGDCEDYAIAKYFLLKELGVPVSRLRITYVRATRIDEPHMVLAYYSSASAEPLILDNLDDFVRSASARKDLIPVYSFNDEDVVLVRNNQRGNVSQIRNWHLLNERLRAEAAM